MACGRSGEQDGKSGGRGEASMTKVWLGRALRDLGGQVGRCVS